MKVLLLNGPPRSGKDTLGRLICNRLQNAREQHTGYYQTYKMSQPLKDGIPAAFGVSFEELEATKDAPHRALLGLTFRRLQISMSEEWLKKVYGQDVFGRIAVQRMLKMTGQAVIVTDAGFTEEARPIVDAFNPRNVTCVQLHRPGCDFSKDSRGWLDCKSLDILQVSIENNSDSEDELLEIFRGLNNAMELI